MLFLCGGVLLFLAKECPLFITTCVCVCAVIRKEIISAKSKRNKISNKTIDVERKFIFSIFQTERSRGRRGKKNERFLLRRHADECSVITIVSNPASSTFYMIISMLRYNFLIIELIALIFAIVAISTR